MQNPKNIESDFYKSIFIECIIELHFLLKREDFTEIVAKINFQDDIPEHKPKGRKADHYNDIVSLVAFYRHAVCHSDAYTKRLNKEGQYISYSFQAGLNSILEPAVDHLCKYEDDIACIFGHQDRKSVV